MSARRFRRDAVSASWRVIASESVFRSQGKTQFLCHCEERSDEAIQMRDCFASLAMTDGASDEERSFGVGRQLQNERQAQHLVHLGGEVLELHAHVFQAGAAGDDLEVAYLFGFLEHLGDLRHLLLDHRPGHLLGMGFVGRGKIDLVQLAHRELLDRPEHEEHVDVLAHRRGRHADGGRLVQLVVGAAVREDDELGFVHRRARVGHGLRVDLMPLAQSLMMRSTSAFDMGRSTISAWFLVSLPFWDSVRMIMVRSWSTSMWMNHSPSPYVNVASLPVECFLISTCGEAAAGPAACAVPAPVKAHATTTVIARERKAPARERVLEVAIIRTDLRLAGIIHGATWPSKPACPPQPAVLRWIR